MNNKLLYSILTVILFATCYSTFGMESNENIIDKMCKNNEKEIASIKKGMEKHNNWLRNIDKDTNWVDWEKHAGVLGLHYAIWQRNIKLVSYLLDRKADINYHLHLNQRLTSPLYYAISYRDHEMVELLLQYPDVDTRGTIKYARSYLASDPNDPLGNKETQAKVLRIIKLLKEHRDKRY